MNFQQEEKHCDCQNKTEIKDKHQPAVFGFSPWLSPAAAEPGARLHAETPPGPPPGTGRNPRVY